MDNKLLAQTIEHLKNFEEVDAIALGGSRASDWFDDASDYDVYAFLNRDLPVEKRAPFLNETCKHADLGKTHWGVYWDDCVLRCGTPLEITYMSLDVTRQNLENHLVKHIAHGGYTTCVCFIVFNAIILHDPRGLYEQMKKRFSQPYPEQLRKNIITQNRELLYGITPSYLNQLEKAVSRNDFISVNHRMAVFASAYFDIIFALNRQFHPGEKKLIKLCKKMCPQLPANFEENLLAFFAANGDKKTIGIARNIIANLDFLLQDEVLK